ncbi:MAG: S8 family serine peptidase [Sediminicola sp.]
MKIKGQYNSLKMQAITKELSKDFTASKERMMNMAKAKGWIVSKTLDNGNFIELQEVGPDGAPIYYTTFNDHVSNVSRANTLYSGGLLKLDLTGKGMKVGVWDGGVARTSHQEFSNRAIIGDAAHSLSPHATMVLGTLIATGIKERARGVAFMANATTNDWTRDKLEVAEAAANGLLLSNHSYGIESERVPDWYFGSYIKVSQDWDKIMFNAPYYLMVTAAGNSQKMGHNSAPIHGTSAQGFDLMLGFAASKNGITVSAVDTEIDSQGNISSASVANYSSFGPMDDGRIKPDIAGGGNGIYAPNSTTNTSYDTSSGTSLATPGITGSMLLLQEYYERLNGNFMKAATLKGIVLHTADDVAADGPDYKMGWGVMNSKKGAELIAGRDYTSLIKEDTLIMDGSKTFTVIASGKQPLIASISWTDPASDHVNKGEVNDLTPALVNDLDIRVYKDGREYLPWKLSAANATSAATRGDNRVDPFERIDIEGASGTYTIVVTHKGQLLEGTQNFSLIVSGIKMNDCNVTAPIGATFGSVTDTSVEIGWEAQQDALFEVSYRDMTTETWKTEYTYESELLIGDLKIGSKYEVRLRTYCSENIASEQSEGLEFIFNGLQTDVEEENLTYGEFSADTPLHFSIYPNPAAERISFNGIKGGNAKYAILTTTGLTVKTGDANGSEIDVTSLASGLYILSVQDLQGVSSTRFYKD